MRAPGEPVPAQRPTEVTPASLRLAARGIPLVVVTVAGVAAAELRREGIQPGSTIVVLSRGPFGGPTIVRAAGARVAVSADVAAAIEVRAAVSVTAGAPAR